MGIAAGPYNSRDGLVLWYDMGNSKSFRGEATTNLVNTTWSNWNTDASGFSSVGTKNVISPSHIRIIDTNTNLRHWINIYGISGNTTYTFSVKFRAISGTPTLRFQIQNYTDGTYLSAAFPTTTQIGIVDSRDWQTAFYTITTPSNTNRFLWFVQDGDDYVGYTHTFEIKEPQLEARNYVSQFVDGTRGTTVATGGGLLDLSGRTNNAEVFNGATSSSLFGGYVSLDGTNDYVRFPITATTTISVSCWVRSSSWSTQNHPMIVAKGINVEWILWKSDDAGNDEKFGWRSSNGSTIYSTTTAQNNIWYHLLATVGSAGMRLYINGVLEVSNGNTAVPSGSIDVCIGSGLSGGNPSNFLLGDVAAVQIWNKQLSAVEVTQVYQTIRNRFVTRPSIVTSSLILHLDAGNPNSYGRSGVIWKDISGYGSNGTLTNGPSFRAENGGSFQFDGVNDYVETTNNGTLDFYSGNFSVFCWMRSTNKVDYQTLFALDNNSTGNGILLYTNPTNGVFRSWVGGQVLNGSIDICTGKWFFVGISRNSGLVTHYINGISYGTFSSSGSVLSSQNGRIASYGAGYYLNGNIAQVFAYNAALSAAEVLQNYNATKSRFGL